MGRGEPIQLGPFTGGINTAADPTAIADNELVECVNFDIDLEGSLVSRPPIFEIASTGATLENLVFIGKALLAGGNYVFASNDDGTWAFDGTTWTLVTPLLRSRVAIQYQDLVFIVAVESSKVDGGYWDGTTWTNDANMPRGEAAVFYKQRMFIVPGAERIGAPAHQLRFSDLISVAAPTPLSWPAVNLIPVGQGDGEKLVDIIIYNDNLLLFKQDSTWVLAYDISITDAILREVNTEIGASTRSCVVAYENSVFTLHEGRVYEIVNYDFKHINIKVPFVLSAMAGASELTFMCRVGDRLVVRFYGRLYIYGLKTKGWTRWESSLEEINCIGMLVEWPVVSTVDNTRTYYAGCSLTGTNRVFKFIDATSNETERTLTPVAEADITCTLTSKTYNGLNPQHFKKLMWWGVDLITNRDVTGIATPILNTFAVSWHDLSNYTWNDMLTYTWNQPNKITLATTTEAPDTFIINRKFYKFLKALRWRQINFTVILKTRGTTTEGPCKVYGITAIVGTKQTVPKQVS